MLDKKRIQEAEENIKRYFEEGLLRKIQDKEPQIKEILIKNSRESLTVAEMLLKGDYSYLWTVVCSYYAMYYMANAVLYQIGYKIGEKIAHKVTADALIAFVRKKLTASLLEEYEEAKSEALEISGLKADEIIESFDFERVKRSKFQYNMTQTAIKSKASTSLERAKRFLFEMEKLLQ